jgi:hypothetical protein
VDAMPIHIIDAHIFHVCVGILHNVHIVNTIARKVKDLNILNGHVIGIKNSDSVSSCVKSGDREVTQGDALICITYGGDVDDGGINTTANQYRGECSAAINRD